PPAGRFSRKAQPCDGRQRSATQQIADGGQKLNSRLLALGLAGLYATGGWLLSVGHRLPGDLHGPFAFVTTVLVGGHIFMAVANPSTRHALRGMTLGWVDREWALHHHARWVRRVEGEPPDASERPGPGVS